MRSKRHLLAGFGLSTLAAALAAVFRRADAAPPVRYPVAHDDAEWRRLLTPAQYSVLRREGTERPYSSPLNAEHRAGTFSCAGCGTPLFAATTKFDSRTGWPSFYAPLEGAVGTTRDVSLGLPRTEVHCAQCGGHLGHVFNDGPRPTGLRYCMNGVALRFHAATGEAA